MICSFNYVCFFENTLIFVCNMNNFEGLSKNLIFL